MPRNIRRGRFSGSRGGMEKSISQQLARGLARELSKTVRNTAVQICNGLSEAGPGWTGTFSASWDVIPSGGTPRQRRIPELFTVYEYTYRNFPLKIFEPSIFDALIKSSGITWEIVNTTDYADQALDMSEGNFYRPNSFPVQQIVKEGFRPYNFADKYQEEHYRWQISDGPRFDSKGNPVEPDSAITAKADWFETYGLGGGLQRDMVRSMRIEVRGSAQ